MPGRQHRVEIHHLATQSTQGRTNNGAIAAEEVLLLVVICDFLGIAPRK
jgi:hypothetical protein